MNQLLLSALRMHRLALVVVGLAIVAWALVPTAAYASSGYDRGYDRGDNHGSAEWVYPRHGDYHGHQNKHCAQTYTVRKGDTLSKLARHYGTSVHALAQANRIRNPNRIYVGQRLCIPKQHGGHHPPEPRCKATHSVAHGDSLVSIARHYHTSVDKIISDNSLRGPHYIHKGQQLCIK